MNEDIHDTQIRVIGNDGSQLGIMSSKDALNMAYDSGYDLVKIAPLATPPVCKIMDYSKYCFEQVKREKEAHKNQKVVLLKEVQLSVKIEDHDLNTKLNHAIKFLGNGNKVKVTLRLKGRENQRPELGVALMKRFAEGAVEYANIEKQPKLENRVILMILAPKTDKSATSDSSKSNKSTKPVSDKVDK